MSMHDDYVLFLDAGTQVPYYVKEAKYVVKPNIYTEMIELDFKIYFKAYNQYFVGIHFSSFVRRIFPYEFDLIKKSKLERDLKLSQLCKKSQLIFDL